MNCFIHWLDPKILDLVLSWIKLGYIHYSLEDSRELYRLLPKQVSKMKIASTTEEQK